MLRIAFRFGLGLELGIAQLPLGSSLFDTTRHVSRIQWVGRVEPCCSTSSTQPKCIGSTRWTCGDAASQLEFGLIGLALALGLGLGIVLTIAVSNFGSGGSKVNAYRREYPHITTSIIVCLLKFSRQIDCTSVICFREYSRKITLCFTFSITA